MAQTPIRLLISFETLAEAVLALEPADQLRLRSLLDQEIDRIGQQSQEQALVERGAHFPLRTGLSVTAEPIRSDRTDISIQKPGFP